MKEVKPTRQLVCSHKSGTFLLLKPSPPPIPCRSFSCVTLWQTDVPLPRVLPVETVLLPRVVVAAVNSAATRSALKLAWVSKVSLDFSSIDFFRLERYPFTNTALDKYNRTKLNRHHQCSWWWQTPPQAFDLTPTVASTTNKNRISDPNFGQRRYL